jgi:electron transfer flavoprotein alpha subunit
MTQHKNILVIAETLAGKPVPLARELLALARQLAVVTGGEVAAMAEGDAAANPGAALIAHGADRVFLLPLNDSAGFYQSDVWLAAMQGVLHQFPCGMILSGHTAFGADLAPRLAMRLKAAIATGCEQVTASDGKFLATRPCFGNKAREVLALNSTPAIATVRAKVNDPLPADPARRGDIVELPPAAAGSAPFSRVLERNQEAAAEGPRLEDAAFIVGGGRGLGGPDGFKVLEELAAVLGGAVGASRVAVDMGWCPHSMQIGLTGKTVTPELYIAVGISGASHHMAGCGNSKAILAINSDPEAAIFKDARFGVVGDYKAIVPALKDEILKRKAQ